MRPSATGRVGANVPHPRRRRTPALASLVAACAALAVLPAACRDGDAAGAGLDGHRVEVLGGWGGAEEAAFRAVLDGFEAVTGARVTFTSVAGEDLSAVLDARLAEGNPPDLAVVPQPGVIATYARRGALVPLDDVLAADGAADGGRGGVPYAAAWDEVATVDGTTYGLWFKAANKSLLWYALEPFEEAGVVPPARLDRLAQVAAVLRSEGRPAFAVPRASRDGWAYTDLFENLYLRLAGPDRYDALARHRLPWTDPSVVETLRVMATVLTPDDVAGNGPRATFVDAVADLFAAPPRAAMLVEGDFVPGVAGPAGASAVGVDVDAVPFPEAHAGDRFVVGGGDAVVLLRSTAAADALVRWLATPDAAEVWVRLGGFVSPNQRVDLAAYPDATTRRVARAVLEAGNGFRFDLSDLQPPAFGGSSEAPLWTELQAFVTEGGDPKATAARLEAAATAAWADAGEVSGG